jgi:hypothetical protein
MDIEWMEGGALYHGYRLLHGLPIYTAPTDLFLPYPYPPGHAVALALVGLFELDFWSGRLVSISAFSAVMVILSRQVSAAFGGTNHSTAFALSAAGIMAVSFPTTAGWFDLIRNDSLALALAVASAALVAGEHFGTRRLLVVALVLTAAVFTKQTNAIFAAWIVLWVAVRNWRAGMKLAIASMACCGILLAAMQLASDGHFWDWIFAYVHQHRILKERYSDGLWRLIAFAPVVVILPLLALYLAIRKWMCARTFLWFGMLTVSVPASLLPYSKIGGFLNNLMPMLIFVGPVSIMLLADLGHGLARRSSRCAGWVHWSGLLLCAGLVIYNHFPMRAFLPDARQRANAGRLNQYIAQLKGGVMIPTSPFLAVRNGHDNEQYHAMSYYDAFEAHVATDVGSNLDRSDAEWAVLLDREVQLFREHGYQPFLSIPPSAQISTLVLPPGFLTTVMHRPRRPSTDALLEQTGNDR